MGQFKIIIDCFNKMENSTLFTSLDLGARLKDKDVKIGNVHNFVYIAFQMGVTCRDKIKNPKCREAKFIYMKERSLTNDEITKLTTRPQCYDFMKQIKADFKKHKTYILATQKKHDPPERRDHMLDKRKAKRELFVYLQGRGRTATTDGKTIEPPKRIYGSIQEEIINLLNISAIPLTTKQISNYFGIPHKSVSTGLSKMLATGTAKKYIKKTKGGWNPCYTCDLPNGIDVPSLYIIIKSDIKPISRPDTINIKDRPVMRRMADLLNTYLPNSKFTIDEFIKSFEDSHRGENVSKGTAGVFLGRAGRQGYITTELIPKSFKSGKGGPKVKYVKILNIAEKEMTNITKNVVAKKEEPIVTESIDDKAKVNVPYKLVNDMKILIQKQDERVLELKQKLGEMFDENSTLITQNKILNQRVTHQVDFDMDLSKYQDNLQQ